MKSYYTQQNIGKAKYVVNFHDGKKTHNDGSPFFDIAILSNKRDLAALTKELDAAGYSNTRRPPDSAVSHIKTL